MQQRGKADVSLEVITLPVRDVDRALRFYGEQVGFTLDIDYAPTNAFRVVQLTPPGSRNVVIATTHARRKNVDRPTPPQASIVHRRLE